MPELSTELSTFYAQQSLLTDPREHAGLFAGLPTDVPALVRTVQGLLIHPLELELYHVQLSGRQREEVQIRAVAHMLSRLHALDPAPLTTPREPAQRLVGNCRDHATLFVSMLRHQGIPARVRAGFAAYFGGRMNHDHWVAEYWDEARGRWLLIDPQIDDQQRDKHRITFDTLDMRTIEHFYLAGQAWQLCREGRHKSYDFGFNNKWKGWSYLRRQVIHDLDALNKVELLPWDLFGDMMTRKERDVSVEDRAFLDRLAEMTVHVDDHLDKMRAAYEAMPYSRVVQSRLRLLGLAGDLEAIDPAHLRPSDGERLAIYRSRDTDLLSAPIASELSGTPTERDADLWASDPWPAEPTPAYVPYELPETWADAPPDEIAVTPTSIASGRPAVRVGAPAFAGLGDIVIRGARQHNLKNIDVAIPRFRLVVITGVSGSGKSSLAFDTLYAEGQRRYVESLSAYARQFLGQMEKPNVDQIVGLSPTIAIEQRTVSRNPRSTVGTVTEVSDYLRVLYARVGTPHCPQCGRGVQPQSARQIADQLAALTPGTRFQLLAPIVRGRKGTHAQALRQARRDGYSRARVDGEAIDLVADGIPDLSRTQAHTIELIVDRLAIPADGPDGPRDEFQTRLADSVETALKAGQGLLVVLLEDGEEVLLSEHLACPHCDISLPDLKPSLFSFNAPDGMCPDCNGLGVRLTVDPELIVTRPHLSLLDGASPWWGNLRQKGRWWARHIGVVAEHHGVDLELPWNDLPETFRDVLLYGSGEQRFRFTFQSESESGSWSGESERPVQGAVHQINRLFRQTKSEFRRRFYMQFMGNLPCPTCQGERLCPEARFVTVGGVRLPELSSKTIAQVHRWVGELAGQLAGEQREIGGEVLKELRSRLQFMLNVGLHYLTLDRPAPSLSGGEGQRIRLASQLGCGLVGVLYILDEPSIGLHARDHRALLDTLCQLRDQGNTVVVIEHDEQTMRTADWLIDLGPGPGMLGGEVVAAGTPDEVAADPRSLTGRYLSGELQVTAPNGAPGGRWRREPQGWLTVAGARLHNLKEVDARFPVGVLCCVTGVSGSGKSSLVAQTLHPALSRALHGAHVVPGAHARIDGLDQIDKVIHITQAPIGRTPRSNPGTYVGAMTPIRAVYAATPEAKARGYGAGRFSFNTKGGRCEACRGHGRKRVEMHFLPDVWVACQECGGTRYNRQTLEVTYKGASIADVLDMDVQEALDFFAVHPKIARILGTLRDVGMEYVKLGQSALTLSGGEAQRVKLAKELSRRDTGRTLYILDEPTTGLHFADIQKLLDVLHRLVDAGNTVVVIEHNLDVIKTADWILDLGPEGGEAGGYIVTEGTPEEVARVEGSYTGQFLRQALSAREWSER